MRVNQYDVRNCCARSACPTGQWTIVALSCDHVRLDQPPHIGATSLPLCKRESRANVRLHAISNNLAVLIKTAKNQAHDTQSERDKDWMGHVKLRKCCQAFGCAPAPSHLAAVSPITSSCSLAALFTYQFLSALAFSPRMTQANEVQIMQLHRTFDFLQRVEVECCSPQ